MLDWLRKQKRLLPNFSGLASKNNDGRSLLMFSSTGQRSRRVRTRSCSPTHRKVHHRGAPLGQEVAGFCQGRDTSIQIFLARNHDGIEQERWRNQRHWHWVFLQTSGGQDSRSPCSCRAGLCTISICLVDQSWHGLCWPCHSRDD